MKNLINNTRIAAFALLLSFTVAFSTAAQATEDNNAAIEFKFIGNLKNQPVFQLSYNGTVENEFTVVVRDNENNIIYKDVLKGSQIQKKFVLNTEEIGGGDVTFEINKKGAKTIVYEVSSNARLIHDVVVNKVK